MKLIDNVGDFRDRGGRHSEIRWDSWENRRWSVRKRTARTLMDLLLGDVSQYLPSREKMMEQQVGFYYLWK